MKNENQIIPYGSQTISEEDIEAVIAVLRSEYLTQGPVVPFFEEAIKNYCHARHAVAVNSATSALHIACLALDLGPNDCLWTSPITFVASANCALYCGAKVDFVDINPNTFNMCAIALERKLIEANLLGKLPKVVVPVHLCGQPCDMAAIHALSIEYGFKIIEDASHAIGAKYKNDPVGNCKYSNITVFSFHPVKIITSGEGGMAVTNDEEIASKLRRFRSHGISNTLSEMIIKPAHEIWNYQQIDLGFNYRMSDIQAALGVSQMTQLDGFVEKRQKLAKEYNKLLSKLPIQLPWENIDCYSSFHLYVIRFKFNQIKQTQRFIYESLRASGIFVNLHYIPVYKQPYYEKMGFVSGYCPNAELYFSDAITLPLFPKLSEMQQLYVFENLKTAIIDQL
jgi:UDP-4-amino-4,6-dideoxy-N-acetyl-beta-L-altrosamine transaminase